jgi:hypothetical protein
LVEVLLPFGIGPDDVWPTLLGSPRDIAEGLIPHLEIGFRHVIVAFQPPYDAETIARLPEVRQHLDELTGTP